MRFFSSSLVLFATAVLGQGIVFINPSANGGTPTSQYAIFAESSVLHVVWTEGTSSKPTSLVLFQMNGTELIYPFEYLIRKCISCLDLQARLRNAKSTGQKMWSTSLRWTGMSLQARILRYRTHLSWISFTKEPRVLLQFPGRSRSHPKPPQ